MSHWLDRRCSGILLHISSLPGPQPCGVLGEEARIFLDFLVESGFSVWQFLPLGPTHGHGSPYESLSSFAGNPEFIDLRDCLNRGWIEDSTYQSMLQGVITPEVARIAAAGRFWAQVENDRKLADEIEAFETSHRAWLDDYALFSALKKSHNYQPWWQWSEPLRDRLPDAIAEARETHAGFIRKTVFEQYIFSGQWQALKNHAESRGIQMFGDLPIYVSHDSSDVWCDRHHFTLNRDGLCEEVAGVPPDYFSDTGQRWGNPLYRWESMQNDGFQWWINRVRAQLERMHLMRIDHFRGLEAYWAIPGDRQDGKVGQWRKAPGAALLEALKNEFGALPFVAEDLGLITPEVDALRHRFGLPGMKVLQFSFGGDAYNPYLPHNHEPDSVAYTGTHDNDTTQGWFQSAPEHVRKHLLDYLQTSPDDMPWSLIRTALASVSKLAIIPMQDLLSLGTEARLNMPATVEGNWSWRLGDGDISADIRVRTNALNRLYGR